MGAGWILSFCILVGTGVGLSLVLSLALLYVDKVRRRPAVPIEPASNLR